MSIEEPLHKTVWYDPDTDRIVLVQKVSMSSYGRVLVCYADHEQIFNMSEENYNAVADAKWFPKNYEFIGEL